MASLELYIHIPFCVKKCGYCDFLSGPAAKEEQEAYLSALLEEIRYTAVRLSQEKEEPQKAGRFSGKRRKGAFLYEKPGPVSTVFFGGGTPSCVDSVWICRLMDAVREGFSLEDGAEITLEANPGTLTRAKLSDWRAAGINRLSLGLQSTDNAELRTLGRIHTYEDFLASYSLAREAGFDNLNIDLMSALPGQSASSYEKSLERVVALAPEHISAYSLIIEEGTPFWDRYAHHPELLPDEDTEREMYHRTKELLKAAGYERYEISNYALSGRECRHNAGYWKRIPYLGFGLGAASLCGGQRYSNTRQMGEYLSVWGEGATSGAQDPFDLCREDVQHLTRKDEMEEFMYLGLRLTAGISSEAFRREFGTDLLTVYGPVLTRHASLGLMEATESGWRLTDRGIDVSNAVLADFLLDE